MAATYPPVPEPIGDAKLVGADSAFERHLRGNANPSTALRAR
jgi:hypothetical protein